MADLTVLADARFVSLTTFRRTGEPVATPVWIARDGDALVVTTPQRSGKVKRLRHTPLVELRPCSRTGRVAPGAPVATGVVEIVAEEARRDALTEVIRRRYGLEYHLVMGIERVTGRGGGERVILRITAA